MLAFSKAIYNTGGAEGIWGFVDSTFRVYCRSTGNKEQQRVYSGYKKLYSNNYQAIVTPDRLVLSLTVPFIGPVRGIFARSV
jgi:hypothetical protein